MSNKYKRLRIPRVDPQGPDPVEIEVPVMDRGMRPDLSVRNLEPGMAVRMEGVRFEDTAIRKDFGDNQLGAAAGQIQALVDHGFVGSDNVEQRRFLRLQTLNGILHLDRWTGSFWDEEAALDIGEPDELIKTATFMDILLIAMNNNEIHARIEDLILLRRQQDPFVGDIEEDDEDESDSDITQPVVVGDFYQATLFPFAHIPNDFTVVRWNVEIYARNTGEDDVLVASTQYAIPPGELNVEFVPPDNFTFEPPDFPDIIEFVDVQGPPEQFVMKKVFDSLAHDLDNAPEIINDFTSSFPNPGQSFLWETEIEEDRDAVNAEYTVRCSIRFLSTPIPEEITLEIWKQLPGGSFTEIHSEVVEVVEEELEDVQGNPGIPLLEVTFNETNVPLETRFGLAITSDSGDPLISSPQPEGGPPTLRWNFTRELEETEAFFHIQPQNMIYDWEEEIINPVLEPIEQAPHASWLDVFADRVIALHDEGDTQRISWSAFRRFNIWDPLIDSTAGSDILVEAHGDAIDPLRGTAHIQEDFMIIFRSHSIMRAVRTGIPDAPIGTFKWIEGIGTDSPFSIQQTPYGVLFFGHDRMVYLLDAAGQPSPVGGPVYDELKKKSFPLKDVETVYDSTTQEYMLGIPPDEIYILDLNRLIAQGEPVWRKREHSFRTFALVDL